MRTALSRSCVLLLVTLGTVTCRGAQPPSNAELAAAADASIEKHRKADATVKVLDAAGKPVPGATVVLAQTRHAFLFGCNIFAWAQPRDPQAEAEYRRRFAEVFNYATQPFYWPSYEGRRGQPIHERTEQVARWCREQGIFTKGHPLAWNYFEPNWLPNDSKQVLDLQLARIDDCVSRFKGLIERWDVVNEATHFDRDELKQRAPKMTAMWAEVGKEEFTRQCFRHARQANPQATLLINDYRVDAAYERLIEKLVDDQGRRLYDVIGIQSHQHGGTWDNRKIWEVCSRFARFGVPLHFTENTILSGDKGWERAQGGKPWSSTPEGEAEQAREVERFYTLLYAHPAVEALTWWDFSDRGAWQSAPAGFLRRDMSPKPAYETLRKLIKDKWWTNAQGATDPQGQAKFRGTLGDYQLTVRVPNKADVVLKVVIVRTQPNEFVVRLP